MAFALVFALAAVVLTVLLRSAPERAVASERAATVQSSAGPRVRGESDVKPWQERQQPTPQAPKDEPSAAPSEGKSKPAPTAAKGSRPDPQAESGQRIPAIGEGDWTRPTPQEVEAANRPRYYSLPAGAIMGLTIPSMGIHDAPVFDSASPMALAKGVAHLPDTSLPWSPTPQRNVYLAGHRMGFRGTWSRMLFYNLGKLGKGDKVVLRDRAGHTYEYRVTETFLIDPTERWVTGQVRGRDLLTLQTCTPIPTFDKRLIVRADRV
jgi:sortase A